MLRLEGLIPVMPTPMRSGVIDREIAERLAGWVGPRVDGLGFLGSSAESGYPSLWEKREPVIASEETAPGLPRLSPARQPRMDPIAYVASRRPVTA
jgi:dihydrodipicolinate synthase/N-acetylneuraminate lyase